MSATNQSTLAALDGAISAHGRWKHRLRDMIQCGKSEVDPSVAVRDDACELGKWLQEYRPEAKEEAVFDRVKRRHGEFHVAVGRVVQLAVARKAAEAEKEMAVSSAFSNASSALTLEIMNWKRLLK